MRVIAARRGEGKTDEAIRLSHETKGILVVADMRLADIAAGRALKLGIPIQRPMTVDQLRQGMGRGLRDNFILDGVELLFNMAFPGIGFQAFTVNQE